MAPPREGGGGALPYISHILYVPPQREGFLCGFGLKTGIDFAHFGLESGMVFEETPCERVNVFIVSGPSESKKEQYANSKGIFFKSSCLSSSKEMMT